MASAWRLHPPAVGHSDQGQADGRALEVLSTDDLEREMEELRCRGVVLGEHMEAVAKRLFGLTATVNNSAFKHWRRVFLRVDRLPFRLFHPSLPEFLRRSSLSIPPRWT